MEDVKININPSSDEDKSIKQITTRIAERLRKNTIQFLENSEIQHIVDVMFDKQTDNTSDSEEQRINPNDQDKHISIYYKIGIFKFIIIPITFLILDFYYAFQQEDKCYFVNLFLLAEAIAISVRLFTQIICIITGLVTLIHIEKVLYHMFILLFWSLNGLIFGLIDQDCIAASKFNYILFWISLGSTILYEIFLLFVIPLIAAIKDARKKKYEHEKMMKAIDNLNQLSFVNGELVDSDGISCKILDSEDAQCSICLEYYVDTPDDKVVLLKCGHIFHHSCNKKWVQTHGSCAYPYCKTQIVSIK